MSKEGFVVFVFVVVDDVVAVDVVIGNYKRPWRLISTNNRAETK